MEKSGAKAYVYAKASGNLGKSFTLERAQLLFEKRRLSDLWLLIFQFPVPMIPEVMLANKIEEKAFENFLSQYIDFIKMFENPDPVLIDQFCIYEAENLKEVAAALCNGEKNLPTLKNLRNFTDLNFEEWPDLKAITKNSKFSWYDKIPDIHEQQKMDFKLDIQVIRHLWKSVLLVKDESAVSLKEYFITEFAIKNIVWALRLKMYFNMEKEQIIPLLIYVNDTFSEEDPVARPALKVLDMPLDNPRIWEHWKYCDIINPYLPGEVWRIDPSWMERKCKPKLHKLAERLFHMYPMTTGALIGWFKIKNYELNCIRAAVESIRLNISSKEAMKAIGIGLESGYYG